MFEPRSEADILRLIRDYPLAWVVSSDAKSGFAATPLPLLAERDEAGRLTSLLGHFARANPQVAALTESPEAAILFQGPHGYVSPGLMSDPDWAPTWNYAVAVFNVRIAFIPDENDFALRRLTEAMEAANPNPWSIEHLGARYETLMRGITAFRAHILETRSRFKLGQDERPSRLEEMLTGLGGSPLEAWMREFNER